MTLQDNLSRLPAADVDLLIPWAERTRRTFRGGDTAMNAVWAEASGKGLKEKNGACHGALRPEAPVTSIGTLHQWLDCPHNYGHEYRTYGKASWIKTEGVKDDLNRPLTVDEGTAWSDWLFNRSWASAYFAAPSFEFARDVAVFLPTDMPANLLLACCTLSRHGGEHRHYVRRWYDLLQANPDMSEDLAYAIAFGVDVTGNRYGQQLSGHNTLYCGQVNLSHIRNIHTQRIVHKTETAWSGGIKTGVQTMYGPNAGVHAKELEELVKGAVKADRVVIPNPFAPVIPAGAVSQELLDKAIPYLMEMFPRVSAQPKQKDTENAHQLAA